jgi:hypothetical protein
MERFGIETRGVYETPWFAYHGPAEEFLLLKSVTTNIGLEPLASPVALFTRVYGSCTIRNSLRTKIAFRR